MEKIDIDFVKVALNDSESLILVAELLYNKEIYLNFTNEERERLINYLLLACERYKTVVKVPKVDLQGNLVLVKEQKYLFNNIGRVGGVKSFSFSNEVNIRLIKKTLDYKFKKLNTIKQIEYILKKIIFINNKLLENDGCEC